MFSGWFIEEEEDIIVVLIVYAGFSRSLDYFFYTRKVVGSKRRGNVIVSC